MGNPFPTSPQPTLAGFSSFLYGQVGIPSAWLPSDSEVIVWAYNTAVGTVNVNIQCVPGPFYLQAVYNLAAHFVLCWAQDPTPFPGNPPAPYIVVDNVPYGYFAYYRKVNNLLGFITGIVQASGDEGSNVSLVTPKQFENLTIGQLQLTTTPWGRAYLSIAQDYGTNWGLS